MPLAQPASHLLRRLRPWISKAVHVRWTVRRSFYQDEADALLLALSRYQGRMPPELALRLEGFLGKLHREWFPPTWRKTHPTYAEVTRDFRWWLDIADRWSQPEPRARARAAPARAARPKEPLSRQPPQLLRLLALPQSCTRSQFLRTWRKFLKENHPDLNPDQSLEERRRFAEAIALWRRA
jgi:hypothetical protein